MEADTPVCHIDKASHTMDDSPACKVAPCHEDDGGCEWLSRKIMGFTSLGYSEHAHPSMQYCSISLRKLRSPCCVLV